VNMPRQDTALTTSEIGQAYGIAADNLETASRFHQLLLAVSLPARTRDLDALAAAGRRLWQTRDATRAMVWPVAEQIESMAAEPVQVAGTMYTCALEAAWQAVEQMRQHVFLNDRGRSPQASERFLCALALDGPDGALGADITGQRPRFDAEQVRAGWQRLQAAFRETFRDFDPTALATMLRLERNRVANPGRLEQPTPPDETGGAAVREPAAPPRPQDDLDADPIAKAVAHLVSDPNARVKDVERLVGVDRRRLHEDERWRNARRAIREARRQRAAVKDARTQSGQPGRGRRGQPTAPVTDPADPRLEAPTTDWSGPIDADDVTSLQKVSGRTKPRTTSGT